MTRRTHSFYSFNTGELDLRLIERADVKHYHSAVATGKNIIGLPQGGGRAKFGSRYKYTARRQMTVQSLAGATFTAPNSGTANNAKDGSTATVLTTAAVNANPFVVLHMDFGSDVTLAALDLIDVSCATGTHASAIGAQSSPDNSVWTDFGAKKQLTTTARSHRCSLAPRQARTARYWRVAVFTGAGPGAITLADVAAWTAGALSAGRKFEINVDPANVYTALVTGGNIDIFSGGTWQTAVPIPHSSAQIAALTHTQSIDTVLLFHEDVAPHRLFRLGAGDLWDSRAQEFSIIPLFDFGDTAYSNGVNEVQHLNIQENGITENNWFNLTLEGYTTEPIQYSDTAATMRANIAAAIEALPNVASGLTVTTESVGAGHHIIAIEFTGGGNAARRWQEMIPRLLIASGTPTIIAARVLPGKEGGEAIMSATRGWPRHGVFFQQRLVTGGFKGRGNAIVASRSGEFFDLDVDFDSPSGAFLDLLDADDDRTIRRFHVGRHLQIFTNSSGHYLSNRTLDRDEPRNYVQSSRAGIHAGARTIDLQGATLYLENGGLVIREFLFSDVEQDYQANNISILNAHLIDDARDLAVRRSSSTTDADLVFTVRADGVLAVMTALRSEEVTGATWFSGETGLYRSVAVDGAGEIYFLRARALGGSDELVLEMADTATQLEAAVEIAVSEGQTTLTGLDVHEGKTVYAYVDGSPQGPFTVDDGAIEIDEAAAEAGNALVGLWLAPDIITLPLRPQDSEAAPLRKRRVHNVRASIFETGNIAIGANGGTPREIALWDFDEVMDVPLMDRLVTGNARRQGILGWSDDGQVRITQTMPAPLEVRAIRIEYDG